MEKEQTEIKSRFIKKIYLIVFLNLIYSFIELIQISKLVNICCEQEYYVKKKTKKTPKYNASQNLQEELTF